MNCIRCNCGIDRERAEALQEMNMDALCKTCSDIVTPEMGALTVYYGKTAPVLMTFPKGGEAERKANAVYRRKR